MHLPYAENSATKANMRARINSGFRVSGSIIAVVAVMGTPVAASTPRTRETTGSQGYRGRGIGGVRVPRCSY